MYNIIPLIVICVSLLIILIIIVRKFPALAVLDVDNMPAEKEARFKEKIVESRLHRFLVRFNLRFLRVFKFLFSFFAGLFAKAIEGLSEAKKKYAVEKAPVTEKEKEEKVQILLSEAEKLENKDDFEEKEKKLIKIIELEPRNADVFQDLGALYLANKKYDEAKQAWVHVLKLINDTEIDKQADVYYNLSLLYKETNDCEGALETIKMAVKLSPNNPRYLDALVEISIMNKDKVEAISAMSRLAEVNPENGKLADFKEQIDTLPESE
jgi:tetratricopeptide (TPR) repeat protein